MSSPIVGGFHLLYSTLLRLLTMLERKYSKLATFPSLYQLFSHFRQFWFFLLRSTYQKKNILPFSRTSCCWGLLINVMKVIRRDFFAFFHLFANSSVTRTFVSKLRSDSFRIFFAHKRLGLTPSMLLLKRKFKVLSTCFLQIPESRVRQLAYVTHVRTPTFIGIRRTYVRLLLLVYAWLRTCVSWHVRSFFPYNISKFSRFFWLFFSGSGSLKT